ncbi:ankyrin repeat-containing domain, PGG domain protein [Tanacetum coccineum]
MMRCYKSAHCEAVLMAISQIFPPDLNFWERKPVFDVVDCSPFQNALEDFEYESTIWKRFISAVIRMILAASNFIVRVIVWSFVKERIRIHESAIRLLASACNKIRLYTHSSTCYHHYYTNPIFEATKQNAFEVIEGEKWIKSIAESYTITAALITTIVFAAAITMPGFAEQDFLIKLPRRLMIGLAALFISTTAMIIAFAATLFFVFGNKNSWMLIPIGALTCLPITFFVPWQFPLVADLISATYGRSIFVKEEPDKYLY